MMFELILNLSGMSFYGNIPYPQDDNVGDVEIFTLQETDWHLLSRSFVDPVNRMCGTLLDYGDVDFFGPSQCNALSSWLEGQVDSNQVHGRILELYSILNEYAKRAIELHTGIVVEL